MKKHLNKGASPPCISPTPEGCSVRFVSQLGLDRSFLKKFAPLVLLALLAACSSGPPALPNHEPELRQISDTGYVPRRKYGTTTLRENWGSPDARIDVSVIAPSSTGDAPFPLIVYLPGLGEPATAGQLWRKAWAEAGYSVVSIQPAALTEEIWGSRQAREGDFQGMAREHFSTQASISRLRTLDTVFAEIRRRAAAGNAPYSQADTTKIVLAGFELGAYTASLAAGERVSGTAGERVSGAAGERLSAAATGTTSARKPEVRALVTLSPYYNRNTTDAEARYAAMSLPVLAVTGSDDDDPFHLVRDPELRKSPWRSMPAGGKYLLSITGGSHTLLAGDGFYDTNISREQSDADEAARKRAQERSQEPPSSQRRRRFGERVLEPMHADSQDRGGRGEQGTRDQSNVRRLRPVKVVPIPFNLNHIAAVTSVSTAFLDAHLRQDAQAIKWLSEDAARWLGTTMQLQVR